MVKNECKMLIGSAQPFMPLAGGVDSYAMESDGEELELVIKEKLPVATTVLQLADGSVFYWRNSSPQRLYTKVRGKEIDAELPDVAIECDTVHGNTIYFSAKQRIFKTVTSPSNGITVAYLRHILQDEIDIGNGILTRIRNGKKYAYRMWDNPDTDGIHIDIPIESATRTMNLRCIHRNQLLYLSRNSELTNPTASRLSQNAVLIEIPVAVAINEDASAPLFYFECKDFLYALDTQTTTFLPLLKFSNVDSVDGIAGVLNGVLTIKGELDGARYLITAKLPRTHTITRETATREQVEGTTTIHSVDNSSRTNPIVDKGRDDMIQSLVEDVQKMKALLDEQIKKQNVNSTDQSIVKPSNSGPTCVICLDNQPNMIFFDCMHVAVCEECYNTAANNIQTKMFKCPNCRQWIKKAQKVFL